VADTSEGAVVVYRDPEVPSFEEREFGPRGPIEAADFDGDGKVDVAVGSAIFLNRLTGR
jgi:FG-GAP repeat